MGAITNFAGLPGRIAAAAGLGAALLAGAITVADAGGHAKERVYDDSFGNLIIISPAGYKRIVVGMGHVAAELEAERAAAAYPPGRHAAVRCHQPPVLWKGRGYMYGLAEGEIPTPPFICD